MIKRIIFDLDNTLIPFPKNFKEGYREVLEKFNIYIEPTVLYNIIGEYESLYDHYDYDLLISFINNKLNTNFDETFLNAFMDMYDTLEVNISEDIIETLKYLSKKYSLVVLTNWITKSQEKRMKRAGILKYFDKIYGGDYKLKPNKKAFVNAMGKYKIDECIMVGDNIEMDIIPAENLGIKTYYLGKSDKYNTIDKINDLAEVL